MDDLAAGPAQRASDDGGRQLPPNLAARKKAPKRPQPAPAPPPDPEPAPSSEAEADHQLDVLG